MREENSFFEHWKRTGEYHHPFVVTEFTGHLLSDHLARFPDADVLFSSNFHDILPNLFTLFPNRKGQTFVVGKGTADYVVTSFPELKNKFHTLEWEKFLGQQEARKKPTMDILVLAEAHPFGGLVPALAVANELKKKDTRFQIWEHSIPVREMFVPPRRSALHMPERSPADVTFRWRNHLGVRKFESNSLSPAVLYFPLHNYPTVSLYPAELILKGLPFVTQDSPWLNEFTADSLIKISANMFSQFDPFCYPDESSVNEGLALSIAKFIKEKVYGNV